MLIKILKCLIENGLPVEYEYQAAPLKFDIISLYIYLYVCIHDCIVVAKCMHGD